MTTSKDIGQERAALMAEFGPRYDQITALLFRHDPIGINFKTNWDEYDPEVRAILPRLRTCSSAADVARVTHEEFVRFFDRQMAGDLSRYEPIAAELWDLWCQRSKPRE